MRRKIDSAFYIADYPTNERYALINERWDGFCPLIDENGYCSLQLACGEEVLPMVCRMYPRSVKKGKVHELSCSNSCEKTLELLMKTDEKLHFEETELELPENVGVSTNAETQEKIEIRRSAIEKMCDRTEPLSARLCTVGRILGQKTCEQAPDGEKVYLHIGESELSSLVKIILRFKNMSEALSEYVPAALLNLGINEENYENEDVLHAAVEKYIQAEKHFFSIMPDAEIYLEKIIVNHMFYEQFPYADFDEKGSDAYLSLCAVYSVLKFLAVSFMADKSEKFFFVRVASAIFRFIEHTDFYHNAMIMMKKEGFCNEESYFL